ncbi:MAG: choice-of-anchor B family protein [Bacteroidia bacterium]
MKKLSLIISFCVFSLLNFAQTPKNLTLLGSMTMPGGQSLAGCWHYNDGAGNEYALVGGANGIAIVDITNPATPNLLFQLPGATSLWHEIKVLGDYAYAVSEGNDPNGIKNGLQIIDLRYLPDSAPNKFYYGDGAIFNQLITAHTVTAAGHYVYVNGHNITALGRGILILDVSDPWNPVYTGAIADNYCHDSYVRGDTIFSSEIYAGQFAIFDISDPTAPNQLATQSTPALFNHNAWLSDDSRYLFVTDEKSNAPMTSYDVSDYNNITQIDTFFNGNFTSHEVHNVRVFNDYVLCPSYGSQLTIVDASHPYNLIEVGNYTTGSSLCWDADPYTASGNIIATDMNSGVLYIFGPTYMRACYLEGIVTDSLTGISLNGVSVALTSLGITASTNPSGNFATGYADAGSYSVTFSKSGYVSKTVVVNLNNGSTTNLSVQLVPIGAGVNDLTELNVILYPNPATTELNISSPCRIEDCSIYDLTGKLVLRQNCSTARNLSVNISTLAKGKYTLKLTGPDAAIYRTDFVKE